MLAKLHVVVSCSHVGLERLQAGAILNSMHLSNVSSMPTCFHSAVSCIKRSAKSLTPTIVKGLHLLCTLFGPIVLCNFETK